MMIQAQDLQGLYDYSNVTEEELEEFAELEARFSHWDDEPRSCY